MSAVRVIANPSSGGADSDVIAGVRGTLSALGSVEVTIPDSEDEFDAVAEDAAAAADLLVVAGGDGTLNRAVNAVAGRLDALVLALVPMGTGNDFARTLGLPDDPKDAALAIVAGEVREVDLGRASGDGFERLFLNACLGGFPVDMNKAIGGELKRRLGPAAFWLAGAKAAMDLTRTTVRLNAVEVADCITVGVGNGRTCGGGLEMWPSAAPDDGLLDGCALGAPDHAAALKIAAKLKGGAHEGLEGVATARAATVRVDSDPPVEVNMDGELFGLETPATFEVAGRVRIRA